MAKCGNDMYHFHLHSTDREIAFSCLPRKQKTEGISEHWRSVPYWSIQWIKCTAPCLVPSRDSIKGGIVHPSRDTCLGKGEMGKKWPLCFCTGMATQQLLNVLFCGSNRGAGRCWVLVRVHSVVTGGAWNRRLWLISVLTGSSHAFNYSPTAPGDLKEVKKHSALKNPWGMTLIFFFANFSSLFASTP